ncbi:MAG: GatB/YqeY domain-containing protein [Verrucomicrobiales bacterium]|nr:GatB/YqeY domain-containing protein [Verrucomicrobiales bacterium]
MTLLEQIDTQIKDAMRARDLDKLNTLRALKSAAKYLAIEKYGADGQADDDDVRLVARKEIKKRNESIEVYEKNHRPDAAAKERAEKAVLETFLPAALSDAELEGIVSAAIAETGATGKAQLGLVMKAAIAKAAGRADGKQISAVVGRLLK